MQHRLTLFAGALIILSVRSRFRTCVQVKISADVKIVLSESPRRSLTQEASLQEVDNLRKQIIKVKGADHVVRG